MSENPATAVNGLDAIPPIKSEPIDPLLDADGLQPVIPKEYVTSTTNGLHEDSDCDDISFFTQIEVDNTRKCLENTRLIIKDFETQLDWHLQQYMTLRNIFNPRRTLTKNSQNRNDDASKRQDLLSISQLSAIIANHPEGNKKFIKRKGPISNGTGGRKRRRNKESDSEEETDFSDEDSEEYDEEDFEEGNDSEAIDDPDTNKAKPKKRARGRKGKNADDSLIVPKDEIEEEIHELVVPKEEKESEDEEMDFEEGNQMEPVEPVQKKPAKRGRKPKVVDPNDEPKAPAKRGPRGKRGQKNMETIDLTNLKTCKVVLNRIQEEDSQDSLIEIKDEEIDRDELNELLQPKLINSLENFSINSEKPILILKQENLQEFDFNECKTSNVIVTFEHCEALPEFLFIKNVANRVLNGLIKVVLASVFDQHLNARKE